MPEKTWQEKILEANDKMHSAVNSMLRDPDLPVETKCRAAAQFDLMFQRMRQGEAEVGIQNGSQ